MTRVVAMGFASLLLASVGCASTYKFSSPPPGHPANPNLAAPVHERSMALAEADSVDPRPAKSNQWTAQRRENTEHQQHQMHQMHQMKKESTPMPQGADHHQHQESEKRERKTEETQQRAPDNFESQLAQILQAYFET
ncbi:hypothetical protein HUU40_14135, partial [candidate division KSB1 bacterium]|nr:hypothetical protein [candidate division KSB1 bacterium]